MFFSKPRWCLWPSFQRGVLLSYAELALWCDTWAVETGFSLVVITVMKAAGEIAMHTEFSINQSKKSNTDGIWDRLRLVILLCPRRLRISWCSCSQLTFFYLND